VKKLTGYLPRICFPFFAAVLMALLKNLDFIVEFLEEEDSK
jgi:hypothetical protein